MAAALAATLCVSSLRNTRRAGASLIEQADSANAAVRQYAAGAFVTGILGRLDLRNGRLVMLNAGHVLPLLHRAGKVTEVPLPVNLPFGLEAVRPYRICRAATAAR